MMKKMTMDSRVKDLWENPVAHDILAKILMQKGIDPVLITNPLTANLKIKSLKGPTAKILDEGFWTAFLKLVNSQQEIPPVWNKPVQEKWWKEAVFYQIYPRTFCDSDQDGIGDIPGIITKLDYLKDLGVDCIWLSPIYDSPMDDNGYDIRDYRKINPDFGTMEDFEELLKGVHERGMRLIMDLVVNHTSDEHRFFREGIEDKNSPYRDYYFIKDHEEKKMNNWTSFFSGSAWDRYGSHQDWALHLFSKKQVDLNWDNPKVRKDVASMVDWWLSKGVDGFRLDVINFISKNEGLPDGDPSIGKMMGIVGIENYYYGPHLHEYLHELHEAAFKPHNAFSVGETPGIGMEMAKLLTGEQREELDMIFSFDHLETPGHIRFEDYRYDLNYLRDYMIDWMKNYGNNCWMSVFFNNHDNPRMVSKVDPSGRYRKEVEELLAVLQMTLKGTPFVYQGDEMGLVNYDFNSIDDLNDIESVNYYKELLSQGRTSEDAWNIVLAGTRDHARQLLPWNEANLPSYLKQDIHSEITEMYKELIKMRKKSKTLVYGDFKVINAHSDRFVFTRTSAEEEYLIDANLSEKPCCPHKVSYDWVLVWPKHLQDIELPAYGIRVWKKTKLN